MEDDLFQSLGGSLMKDLLADLQGDEGEGNGWLSLEQLEKELSQLDDNSAPAGPAFGGLPLPPAPTAASMVVSQQQQQQQQPMQGVGLLGDVTVTTAPAEAWKEQLQKITAMSLDQDFLAADTVRKQQQAAAPQLPPGFLAEAQDYDEKEKATIMPPPGLGGALPGVPAAATVVPLVPEGRPMPKTPQNSVSIDDQDNQKFRQESRMPKTPRNSVIVGSSEDSAGMEKDVPVMKKVSILKREPIPEEQQAPSEQPTVPTKSPGSSMVVPPQGRQPQMMPQGMGMPPPHMTMQGMPVHGMPPMGMIPQQGGMMIPPVAMPAGGPAWQSTPPPPPPPRMRVFCNPNPSAPPIPAHVLESRWMKSRDITYIVHSMLKPVLVAGFSDKDYDIQWLYRQSGGRPAGPQPRPKKGKKGEDPNVDIIQKEMESRAKKSKEWAAKQAVLGAVAKANVTRPRALIASPVMSQENQDNSESASEQKQRARLWKARIYCDQAYQAYLTVVDIWAQAAPGTVPPQVHAPLIKLMKCLGTVPVSTSEESTSAEGGGEFRVDATVLELFLKLSKGRTLFARIVEQALLPPSAVQAVLPVALKVLYNLPPPSDNKSSASAYGGDMTDDRIFRALSSVIQTLPNLYGDVVLNSLKVMKNNSEAALSSTARMECLHSLLQRGSSMAASDDPELEAYKAKWTETESSFMNILSGM